MTFEIEINGRMRSVSVERLGDGAGGAHQFRVSVDGRVHLVDARRVGASGLSLILPDLARASHDVGLARTARTGEWVVHLAGGSLRATLNGRRAARGGAGAGDRLEGEQRVVAPMPGRVVRVLVKPGDEIALRQGLVVVEAMKMENELASPKAGRVKDVQVAEGMSVEAGRVLVVIE
jgi:biotin carboxyl carrier protein